jgi:hypothetical protein
MALAFALHGLDGFDGGSHAVPEVLLHVVQRSASLVLRRAHRVQRARLAHPVLGFRNRT